MSADNLNLNNDLSDQAEESYQISPQNEFYLDFSDQAEESYQIHLNQISPKNEFYFINQSNTRISPPRFYKNFYKTNDTSDEFFYISGTKYPNYPELKELGAEMDFFKVKFWQSKSESNLSEMVSFSLVNNDTSDEDSLSICFSLSSKPKLEKVPDIYKVLSTKETLGISFSNFIKTQEQIIKKDPNIGERCCFFLSEFCHNDIYRLIANLEKDEEIPSFLDVSTGFFQKMALFAGDSVSGEISDPVGSLIDIFYIPQAYHQVFAFNIVQIFKAAHLVRIVAYSFMANILKQEYKTGGRNNKLLANNSIFADLSEPERKQLILKDISISGYLAGMVAFVSCFAKDDSDISTENNLGPIIPCLLTSKQIKERYVQTPKLKYAQNELGNILREFF